METWEQCTEQELLIDLGEWASAAGSAVLTRHRCAVTARLWTLLERVPFDEGSARPIEVRLRHLVRAAQLVLDRLRERLPGGPAAPGVVADFALPLRCRSGEVRGCALCLHVERTSGELFVTLGVKGEFSLHPLTACTPLRQVRRIG